MNEGDFARVYDAQYSRVFHYLLWRLRDRNTAELFAAEVFATALTACQKGAAPRQIGSWLVGIADHLASEAQRRLNPISLLSRPTQPLSVTPRSSRSAGSTAR